MHFKAPIINFPRLNFDGLINELDKNSLKLRQGSTTRATSFKKDVEKFKNSWLRDEETYQLTDIELRSVSTHLFEARKSFKTLLDNDLIEEFSQQMADSENVTNKKRLIELTFQYFQLLKSEAFVEVLKIATKVLEDFSGRNIMLKAYKENLPDLYYPLQMLSLYSSKEEIQKKLGLSVNSDYYKTILILNLVSKLETLNDGEDDNTLFKDIKRHKDFAYDEELHVAEYTARLLIKKMMGNHIDVDFSHWRTHIIDLLGDPRTVSNAPWERVGDKYKTFLVRRLSQEDLNLFLDVLGNPENDEIYKYRKKFWKEFNDYVQDTKLFITEHDLKRLPAKFRKRFNGSHSSYSRISDSKRSYLYIDLGELKIIEGTKESKVRLYSESPVDLNLEHYDCQDFYKGSRAEKALIAEITHSNSKKGKWQEKLLNKIKRLKPVNIKLKDTLLEG